MLKTDSMKEKLAWTTWEDLLLTCAVKRYGLQDWNAIAMELQRRVSVPVLVNAQICLKKYNDLKRRFTDNISDENVVTPAGGDEVDSSVPWLEELRKRRIDELRRKVDGHDLSIQNLETKAKRLEEEREQSYEIDYKKPDLEKDTGEDRSENDKNNATGNPPVDNDAGVSASGERSDRENQSVNESNSTDNRGAGEKISEPVQNRLVNPDPDSKPVRADSWNDSSKLGEDKKIDYESAELRDWAGDETKGGIKESSDMQSSASLTRTSGGGYEPVVSPDTMRLDQVNKSEPLVGFFDTIRSHKHGSMFEIRLDSQKSDKYKNLVKQHVDLETVHTRIENGSYSICTTKFYLDLLLLVNNAIIFFPKASPESAAAFDLRNLVLKDMKKKCIGRQSDPYPLNPKPDLNKPDALLAKQKSSTPLIVCRKRSSISSKPSSSNKAEEKPVIKPKPPVKSSSSSEEESSIKLKLMEKPVTGARSMRRSGNGRTNSTTTSTNKGEAPKTTEKKKTEVLNTAKKRGAADFLKRIKKNSPGKGTPLLETLKSSPENSSESSRRESRDRQKKRVDERKEVTTRQKGCVSGGAGRKPVKEEDSPSKRGVGRPAKPGKEAAPVKRGREGGEAEVAAKKPKKRTRR